MEDLSDRELERYIIDSKGMKHVIPNQGAIYADKGYCDINAKKAAAKRNLHLA